MMKDIIFSILLTLPPNHLDQETEIARRDRLEVIATAINYASSAVTCDGYGPECEAEFPGTKVEIAFLLITTGRFESGFAENVHKDRCRPYQCDVSIDIYGKIHFRARTPWQMQRHGEAKLYWDHMMGADQLSTNYAAYAAARMLSRSKRACGSIPGAISMYAHGRSCQWKHANERAFYYYGLLKEYKNGTT